MGNDVRSTLLDEQYEIVSRLVPSLASEVYVARQRSSGQLVALKLLRGAGPGPSAHERVRCEREVCAYRRVRHPRIASLVDAGQLAEGYYVATAFVPGHNLATLLAREGALAAPEARHLMLQVLEALACAHDAGVIHRDVTPSNIMIVDGGARGARRDAVLIDFGVSAIVGGDGSGAAELHSDMLGTPGYAAPEQWRGAEPSARADLFSWAICFVECLTAQRLYAGSEAEIIYRVLSPEPVPLPGALAGHPSRTWLSRALCKDAASRTMDARALFAAVAHDGAYPPLLDNVDDGRGRGVPSDDVRSDGVSQSACSQAAHRGPLVGRAGELEQLLEHWHLARAGAGQSTFLVGEPGIGKSRLTRELEHRVVSDRGDVIEVRCTPDIQLRALTPVVDALERTLGLRAGFDAASRRGLLERAIDTRELSPSELIPLLAPLFGLPVAPYRELDISPPRRKALTLEAIATLLFAMAGQRPLLLWIEDLQWADPTTSELIAMLVCEIPRAAVHLVMTARPERAAVFPTTAVHIVPLGKLVGTDVRGMLLAIAGGRLLPDEVIDHVTVRADGVPLFVEELFRMLVESGALVERADRYQVTGALERAAVPRTLQAMIAARLAALHGAVSTAQLAAALGQEFSYEVLAMVSPLGEAVRRDLDALLRSGFVQHAGHATGVFRHALVRDAAYALASEPERRATHARIAAVFEQRFPEVVRARPDLLAHHHAEAAQTLQAIGYAERAARVELERSAYLEAIEHATRIKRWVAELPVPDIASELGANGVLIQALMATRGWAHPEVKQVADRSSDLVSRFAAGAPHRVALLWALFTYHHVASHRDQARAAAAQLVEIAERGAAAGLRAAAAVLYGLALFAEGDHVAARPWFERASSLYDVGRDRDHGARFGLDSLAIARAYTAHLLWFAGSSSTAFEEMDRAIRWARELRHIPSIAVVLLYACTLHQRAGDRRAVVIMAEEIIALNARYGLPAYEGYATILHAWATGDEARARAVIARLIALGCRLGLPYYRSLIAQLEVERGDFEAAIESIDQCLALCRECGEHFNEADLHRRRAMYESMRCGRVPSVVASLERSVQLARHQDMPRIEVLALLELRRGADSASPWNIRLGELFARHPDLIATEAELQ